MEKKILVTNEEKNVKLSRGARIFDEKVLCCNTDRWREQAQPSIDQ